MTTYIFYPITWSLTTPSSHTHIKRFSSGLPRPNGEMRKVMEPYSTKAWEKIAAAQWTKEGLVMRYDSGLTRCVLHRYHEGLVFQEVLVVLYDIWMVEQFEHLTLVLCCQAFVSWHLLHGDLLQDDKGPITAPAAQVNNPDRPGDGRNVTCIFLDKE